MGIFALSVSLALPARAEVALANTTLNGQQEATPNNSFGIGTAIFSVNTLTGLYDLSMFVSGIGMADLVGAGPNNSPFHIHRGAPGVNGPIVVDTGYLATISSLGANAFKLSVQGTFGGVQGALNGPSVQENLTDLSSGNLYLNLHTAAFPGGEIRGQLALVLVPEPGVVALGVLFGAGLLVLRRRSRIA